MEGPQSSESRKTMSLDSVGGNRSSLGAKRSGIGTPCLWAAFSWANAYHMGQDIGRAGRPCDFVRL